MIDWGPRIANLKLVIRLVPELILEFEFVLRSVIRKTSLEISL